MAEQATPKHQPLKDMLPAEALEHLKAAHAEMHKSLEALLPPGFVEHRRAARREMLHAARSLIDAALKKMDEKEEKK